VRRKNANQFLAGADLRALVYIANLRFPDERMGDRKSFPARAVDSERFRATIGKIDSEFTQQLRERTYDSWPELWDAGEDRALPILRVMRDYLQRFWREQDEHARDWYIHRAREYWQHFNVQRELSEQVSAAKDLAAISKLNVEIERRLDQPPVRNPFEEVLFQLQRRARKPSLAPRYCPNLDCSNPYFLSRKKGQRFCSKKCARPSELASKRAHWETNKTRYEARRKK